MALGRVRAISLDLDDTLWACEEVIERAEARLYEWLATNYPAITARHSREAMRARRQALAERDARLAADLSRLRVESLQLHAREAGYPESLALAGLEVFLAERNRVRLYADALPLLRRLQGQVPLIALTNGNADIGRAGLGAFFALSLSAADVGAAKPDPAMFHAACRRLSIRTGELLHIGDDPLRDVHAARSIGARAIWVNREATAWPEGLRRPDHEVGTLSDLSPELLPVADDPPSESA